MPSVPKLNSPRISTSALPQIRVPTNQPLESFGGGAALEKRMESEQRLAESILNPIEKLALQEQQKADDIAVLEADNKRSAKKTQLFWDTKDGAATRRGKDAIGVTDEYLKKFDDYSTELESSLSNDRQKAAFKKRTLQEREGFFNQLTQHTYNEYQQYDKDLTESRLSNARNDAVLNFTDPVAITKNLEVQRTEIMNHAQRNGKDAEWVRMKTEESVSSTHSAIVDRMLNNGDDLQAKHYYDANKDQFVAKDAASLEKALEEGSLRGESQRQTDIIMGKGMDMPTALKEAKKIEDPKLRDAVQDRIKSEFSLKKAADESLHEDLFNKAANIIEVNSGNRDKIPPKLWQTLTLQERNSIDARAKQLREGEDPVTNLEVYYDLMSLASSPDTSDAFLKKNLMAYRHQLSESDFKKIVETQTSMRMKDGKADEFLNGVRTRNEVVNDALESAKIDQKKYPKESNLFKRKVDEEVIKLQQQTGKKATTEDVQRITDNLMIKGVIPGTGFMGFFKKEKRMFELEKGEQIAIDPKDIPASERSKIEEALRKFKKPITDDNIMYFYNKKFQGKK